MSNLKILVLLLLVNSFAFAYQYSYPTNIPSGLPSKIKGNYRIIEHSPNNEVWYIYDTNKYINEGDSLKIFPPIHVYTYYGNWSDDIENQVLRNNYHSSLVSIIKKTKKTRKINKATKISFQKALSKIKNADKHKRWSFKTLKNYKNGSLICGKRQRQIGVWYWKNREIYNVNGSAKGLTKHFKMTWKIPIDESLKKCQALF